MMQGSSQHATAKGDMMTITGPFPPGKTVAQVGFSLPQAGESISIQQKLPAALAQVFVGVQKIGNMQVSSPQLTTAQEMSSDGQAFITATGGRLNSGDTLVINLSGLPSHSKTPRTAALISALVIFGIGAWFAVAPGKAHAAQDAKLNAQRARLMDEVVGLERKRRQKALSASEQAKLQRLTHDLERVISELDRLPRAGNESPAA
jgi:small-conductance mechanosensitive channel